MRDAREVAPYETLADHIEVGRGALASDFFRYALLAKGLGLWVDLDLVFLRPIDFEDDYVFGWENKKSINGAVLRLPRDSDMLRELCSIPQLNWRPPFYGPRKAALYYWERLRKRDIRPEDYRWGTFGPSILTYLATKYGVAGQGQGALRLLSGDAFPGRIVPWTAGGGRKPSDRRDQDSPPLAIRIAPQNQGRAARIVLGISLAAARNQRGRSNRRY